MPSRLNINCRYSNRYDRPRTNSATDNHEMETSPDFEEFFAFLNSNEVRYLVVGGYAIAVHANPRYTDDLDIFVARNRENATRLLDALKDFGFGESGLDCDSLMKPNQVIQLGRPPFRIDLLTSIDGVEFEEAWPNRFIGKYGGQTVHFIGREDLIRNKRSAGRARDLADLEDLEG